MGFRRSEVRTLSPRPNPAHRKGRAGRWFRPIESQEGREFGLGALHPRSAQRSAECRGAAPRLPERKSEERQDQGLSQASPHSDPAYSCSDSSQSLLRLSSSRGRRRLLHPFPRQDRQTLRRRRRSSRRREALYYTPSESSRRSQISRERAPQAPAAAGGEEGEAAPAADAGEDLPPPPSGQRGRGPTQTGLRAVPAL
jgi:hypothetical protein